MPSFQQRYGPWAFVAGASEGMGAAYAREAAARGLHVVLAARRAPLLEQLAAELRRAHGVQARCAALDLASLDVDERAAAATAGLEIGLLVYNAAFVVPGAFLERPLAEHLDSLAVNCRGAVCLAHHFGRAMAARGRGGILLMTSGAAFAGAGHIASYAASKAFDLVLGEGLWAELAPRGVDVLSLIAGATNTPHTLATGLDFAKMGGPVMQPEEVVREAFDQLGSGPSHIAGEHNRVMLGAIGQAPRRAVVEAMTATNRRLYGLAD